MSAPLTPLEIQILRAVMDRIVPPDRHPGAVGFGAEHYVVPMLAGDASVHADSVRQGFTTLGPGFVTLTAAEQDTLLRAHAYEPWLVALVALTTEGTCMRSPALKLRLPMSPTCAVNVSAAAMFSPARNRVLLPPRCWRSVRLVSVRGLS